MFLWQPYHSTSYRSGAKFTKSWNLEKDSDGTEIGQILNDIVEKTLDVADVWAKSVNFKIIVVSFYINFII